MVVIIFIICNKADRVAPVAHHRWTMRIIMNDLVDRLPGFLRCFHRQPSDGNIRNIISPVAFSFIQVGIKIVGDK